MLDGKSPEGVGGREESHGNASPFPTALLLTSGTSLRQPPVSYRLRKCSHHKKFDQESIYFLVYVRDATEAI